MSDRRNIRKGATKRPATRKPAKVLPGLPQPAAPLPLASTMAAPIDLCRPERIEAKIGECIADIFRRQSFFLPVIALLNGEVVPGDFWDLPLAAGDALLFLALPAGGDGGKDVFRFVLQLAVTVVAAWALGPAGLGLSGVALQAGVAVATLAGGYLVNALLPPTAASAQSYNSGAGASPTYSLTPQGNQARLGAPIPKQYGRHLYVPDLAAQPWTEYVGNDLFLHQLLDGGVGLSQIHKIRIAGTECWNEDDGYTDAFSDIEIEIVPPGSPVTLFPTGVETSALVTGQTLLGANEEGATTIGPFETCAPGDRVTKVAFDFVAPGGAGHLTDEGAIAPRTIVVKQEVQEIDDDGEPLGDWSTLDETEYQFATRTAQRMSPTYPVEAGRYRVRVTRTNDAATETRDWDAIQWEGLRGFLPADNVFPSQVVAVRMRASNQLSSQASRLFDFIQTAMLPSWDGEGFSAPVATRSIFDAAMDVLLNTEYGGGHPLDRIDVETLASMHATWEARGDTFDGVFDQGQSVWDVLSDILRVGRARPIEIGDTISFVRDEKQTVPKMILTPRQIAENSFRIDDVFDDPNAPDCVLGEYVDERTWDVGATVLAALPGSAAVNPVRKSIKGITDRHRAWQFFMYDTAAAYYRREIVTAGVEFDGRLLSALDLVPVAHPLCDWGRAADVTDYDAGARKLTLSQKALLDPQALNFVRLRKRDGKPWGPVKVSKGASAFTVIMDAGELATVVATQGDPADFIVTQDDADLDIEPTTAVLGHGDMYERDCKLMGIQKSGETLTLSLVVDDDRVYEAGETGEPPAEAAPPRLPATPVGPEIAKIDFVTRGTRFNPILDISIPPVPGATNIIWQFSYDHVHYDPMTPGDGLTLSRSFAPSPTTLWIRVTAVGSVRGPYKEVFLDLTAADAPPGGITGIEVEPLAQGAFIRFTLPSENDAPEDGIKGVLVSYADTSDFDPETEGTLIDYSTQVTTVFVPLETSPTYVRIAAYNAFGTVGLNWSNSLTVNSRALSHADVDAEILQALHNAESIEGSWTIRKDVNGKVAGIALVGGDGTPLALAVIADKFLFSTPEGDVPIVEITEDGARFTELFAQRVLTDHLSAEFAEIPEIRGGRLRSLGNDKVDFNLNDGYLQMDF